ncbi:MAG: hypothetical protein GY943_03350 [Chloroflexi bacterium]|nr:hypothetical protein [Chloroflexota bacterium]
MPPYEHDPYRPKLHDSNSNPPSENNDFTVIFPNDEKVVVTVEYLQGLERTSIADYFIIVNFHNKPYA